MRFRNASASRNTAAVWMGENTIESRLHDNCVIDRLDRSAGTIDGDSGRGGGRS